MKRRKESEIRKLETYFEEKRKTQPPASSDRRSLNNL